MFDLHGRVAVVTGASAGLGRQFALALARQGADLAILARREWKLNEVAEEIRAVGVKCLVVRCDVRLPEDVENAVKAVIAEYGKVDILVNNAGGGKSKRWTISPRRTGSTPSTPTSSASCAAPATSAARCSRPATAG